MEQDAARELFERRRYLQDRLDRLQEEARLIWRSAGVSYTNGAQPPHPSSLSDQQLEMLNDNRREQEQLRSEMRV